MSSFMPVRRRASLTLAVTGAVLASLAGGVIAPAMAAPVDGITAHPDSFGRFYIDSYATNDTANKTPATNAAIELLSPMLNYWTPNVPAVAQFDANGKFIPTSVGTIIDQQFHDANIDESAQITQTRTQQQADQAYLIDRRNQSYSAIAGFGPWAPQFIAGANAATTIPDTVPADATTVVYNDTAPAWADPASTYGPIVTLVNTFRASSASTTSTKAYYNYARPFRWSTDVSIVPTLVPVKKADADALSDGGYPSGHTNAAWLSSLAMAYATPERFQELLTNASEIGNSRIVAGMHSPGDVIGGRILATAVAAAALNNPANDTIKAAARTNAAALLAETPTGTDPYSNRGSNEQLYADRLTYGLPILGTTGVEMRVPKGAEALLETRQPYLTADQRRWVLYSTGLESGHALLDDAEGWGRLNLFAAADGYSAFDTDVAVTMDAAAGGFSAADIWRNDIDGSGSLTKAGTGSLTLAGDNSFSGNVTVNGGTLAAASSTAFGAGSLTVANGVVSENITTPVAVASGLTLQAGSTLSLTMGDNTPALAVGGSASFGGALSLALVNGFVPADDVVIATYGSLGAGTSFSSVNVTGLPAGYSPTIQIHDGAVHLVNAAAVGTITPGTPTVSGTPVVGGSLSVTPGTWAPAPVALSYQWFRGSSAIAGATSASYAPTAQDVGQQLSVTVTGTKTGFVTQARSASASGVVVAASTASTPLAFTGSSLPIVVPLSGIALLMLGAALLLIRSRRLRARRS